MKFHGRPIDPEFKPFQVTFTIESEEDLKVYYKMVRAAVDEDKLNHPLFAYSNLGARAGVKSGEV